MVPTMGGAALAAPRAVGVVAGGVTLGCPMPPAPLDDQHDRLREVPAGRPPLGPRVPHRWGLNVGHDVREDVCGTLGDGPWGVLTFREDKRTRQSYTDPAQTPLGSIEEGSG